MHRGLKPFILVTSAFSAAPGGQYDPFDLLIASNVARQPAKPLSVVAVELFDARTRLARDPVLLVELQKSAAQFIRTLPLRIGDITQEWIGAGGQAVVDLLFELDDATPQFVFEVVDLVSRFVDHVHSNVENNRVARFVAAALTAVFLESSNIGAACALHGDVISQHITSCACGCQVQKMKSVSRVCPELIASHPELRMLAVRSSYAIIPQTSYLFNLARSDRVDRSTELLLAIPSAELATSSGIFVKYDGSSYGPGITKEWFTNAALMFQDASANIFAKPLSSDRPLTFSRTPVWGSDLKNMYAFGRLLGLAVKHGERLPLQLPLFVFRALLGQSVVAQDVIVDYPEFVHLAPRLAACRAAATQAQLDLAVGGVAEVSGADTLEVRFSSGRTFNAKVNLRNRDKFVAQCLDDVVFPDGGARMQAMAAGFAEVVPLTVLNTFQVTPVDIRDSIVGILTIDVADLARSTLYPALDGYVQLGPDSPEVQMFFAVLGDPDMFPEERLRGFLKWMTGSSQVPIGGFSKLVPTFKIVGMANSDDSRYPTAESCFGLLKLPAYTDAASLVEKFYYAMDHMDSTTEDKAH